MELTIPYTLYPYALPHWLAWVLFSLSIGGSFIVSVMITARKKTRLSVLLFFPLLAVSLIVSIVCSVAIMFFIHDQ